MIKKSGSGPLPLTKANMMKMINLSKTRQDRIELQKDKYSKYARIKQERM
jgi:hypothetical protein